MSSQSDNEKKTKTNSEKNLKFGLGASAFHYLSCFGNFPEPTPPFTFVEKKTKIDSKIPIRPPNNSFAKILKKRISERQFTNNKIPLKYFSWIIWSSYGITDKKIDERHTVPSAGALFPLRIILFVQKIQDLESGIYEYLPQINGLVKQTKLQSNFQIDEWFRTKHVNYDECSAILFLVGNLTKICSKYGERGYRYLLLEAGHVAQNVCLFSTKLKIQHIPIGGFDDEKIISLLNLNNEELPLYSIVFGGVHNN